MHILLWPLLVLALIYCAARTLICLVRLAIAIVAGLARIMWS